MLTLFYVFLQFVFTASDPHWACELTHRDPGVAGTYYLYCSQMNPDGVELITVGKFVPNAKRATKVMP